MGSKIAIFALFLAACEGPPPTTYPTEYSLHIDPCVAVYPGALEHIVKGSHYWDEMGVNLVVDGPSTHIIEVRCMNPADFAGEYIGEGIVKLDMTWWAKAIADGYLDEPACVTAHEFGHSLGLQHVLGEAVMNPNLLDLAGITEVDEGEWRRVHS